MSQMHYNIANGNVHLDQKLISYRYSSCCCCCCCCWGNAL